MQEHLQKHGKIYLIGTGILLASGAVTIIRANLMVVKTIRYAGGRHLQMDEMALPTIRQYDPSPILRRMSALITGGNRAIG